MGLNELGLLLLAVVSPIIVSYLTKSTMSSQAKQTVALVISIVLAAVIAILSGGASLIFTDVTGFFESLAIAAPIIYGLQQIVYTYIFKGTAFEHNVLEKHGVGKHEDTTGRHVAE